jgi:hypothetical protein
MPSLSPPVLKVLSQKSAVSDAGRYLVQKSTRMTAKLRFCCTCGCVGPDGIPAVDATVTAPSVTHVFSECPRSRKGKWDCVSSPFVPSSAALMGLRCTDFVGQVATADLW